jgi:glycosyltransferase involved in cell wall biosynthesis
VTSDGRRASDRAEVEERAIVHVMGWHSRQFGSFERFLVELAQQGAGRGMESHFVFQSNPASERFLHDAPARFHVIPGAHGPADPLFASRLARIVRSLEPSHLHAHHGVDLYNALTVARALGVPHRFATKHSTPGESRLTLARTRHRWIARQVEAYFAVSKWVEGRLLDAGVSAAKVHVCHLGVDIARYRPLPDARERVRAELGLSPERKIVLSTSHLRPGKGVELLPLLAAELRDSPGGTTVLAAGSGPLRDSLARKARSLRLTDDELLLLGIRDDVPRLLAAADAFVFPTTAQEGMPLGAIEALASGTPVVATRVSDLGELLPDVALLVEPGDKQALFGACRRLLTEPDEARRLGSAGRRFAGEHLSVTDAAKRYTDIYLAEPRRTR